jgi:hypothetical protein
MSRYHFKIWSCVIAAGAVANSGVSHAASGLPLRNGEYATSCAGGLPNILTSIGHYDAILFPHAEGQDGSCPGKKVTIKGQVYSGSFKCSDIGTRIQSPSGTYRFSYTILNDTTFVSKGKTYHWCSPGR